MSEAGRVGGFRRAVDASPASGYLYWTVALIALLLVTDGFATQAMGFVAPAIGKAWHLKPGALKGVISFGLVGVMIGACGVTPVADKIGVRRVLIVCAIVYGALMAATAWVTDINSLLWLRFASGVALGGAMPAGIALVSDYAPSRLRATLVTIVVSGFSVGGALGAFVGSLAIEHFGWPSVFLIGGVAPVLLAPVLYLCLPESPLQVARGGVSGPALAAVRKIVPAWTPGAEPAAAARRGGHAPVAALFADGLAGPTLLFWVLFFMNLMVLYTLTNWLPTIITGAGLPLSTANAAISFYQLAGVIGAVLISFLADRFGSRLVLPAAFLCASAACLWVGGTASSGGLVVLASAAAGFCVVGGQGAINAFVGNYYPSAIRASGVGWALGIGRLGTILGSYVVGALIELGAHADTLLEICAVPGLFAAAAIWLVARKGASAEPPSAAAEAAGAGA